MSLVTSLVGAGGSQGASAATAGANTGILLDYPFPILPAGAYTLAEEKALIVDDSVSLWLGSGWSIAENAGLAKADAVDFQVIAQATMGAIPRGGRVAEMWGSIASPPANNDNVAIDLNMVAGYGVVPGNWDFFRLYLVWEDPTNRYVLYLARFDNGTWNFVAGNQYYTVVDQPADFHMIAIDRADRMDFACRMFETDSFEGEVKGFNVTIPSRPKKATQRTGFTKAEAGVTDNFRIRGIRITDL